MSKPLSFYAEVESGQGAPQEECNFVKAGRGIPFIRASSLAFLVEGEGISKCEHIVKETASRYKLRKYPKGSIVFAKSGMSSKIGRIYQLENDAYVVNHLAVLIPKQTVDVKCLEYWLKANPPSSLIVDNSYPSIRLGDIRNYQVSIPESIYEQKRIAAILDKAEAVRRKRQKAIDELDNFLRATFLEMFGDPISNPKRWEIKPLSYGIKSIKSGWSAKGYNIPANNSQYGVLKISAVTSGFFEPYENKLVPLITDKKELIHPMRGDLLFSRANTRELVAACCLVESNYPNLFLPDKLWKIETDNALRKEFLKYLLSNKKFRVGLCAKATGTSGSMLNISKEKFLEHPIPLPPKSLQDKFADIVWKIYDINNKYKISWQASENLFKSLMQRAFKGAI